MGKIFDGPEYHHGANRQYFTVLISEMISLDGTSFSDQSIVGQTVFVTVCFGDTDGLDSEIPYLSTNTPIELQGEYIAQADAYDTDGHAGPNKLTVPHFTHHPVGLVVYGGSYYS